MIITVSLVDKIKSSSKSNITHSHTYCLKLPIVKRTCCFDSIQNAFSIPIVLITLFKQFTDLF